MRTPGWDRRRFARLGLRVLPGLALLSVLAGCATPHRIDPVSEPRPIACQRCYDEVVEVRRTVGWHKMRRTRKEVIKKHRCPDCRKDVTFYLEDGTPMIRCPSCAPEGVACDLCRPPAGAMEKK